MEGKHSASFCQHRNQQQQYVHVHQLSTAEQTQVDVFQINSDYGDPFTAYLGELDNTWLDDTDLLVLS